MLLLFALYERKKQQRGIDNYPAAAGEYTVAA